MNRWFIAIIILIMLVVGGWFYFSGAPLSNTVQDSQAGNGCLKDTEKATYEVLENGRPGRVRVSVVDTATNSTIWSRDFVIPSTTHAHSHTIRNCHFYLHKRDGFDAGSGAVIPGYYWGLWRYKYFSDDEGGRVVLFADNEAGTRESSRLYYGTGFSITTNERYISLEKSTLGKSDYALVIKNIETGVDEFVLPLADVLKNHPNAAGSFDVGAFVTRPDGTYLSTIIYDGSRWMAYVYVKLGTWETEIYDTPSDYMAGVERSAPPFAAFLAYTDVIVWAGFDTVTDELLEEQIASGQKKHLIIANLKTGEKTVLEEVSIEREHRFNLKWLSDSELQYSMPDGMVKTHQVR